MASSSYKEANASTSNDPYAQFYYWDAATNNWAFDYDGYYRAYGYPTSTPAANGPATYPYDAGYAAQAYPQPNVHDPTTAQSSYATYPAATVDAAGSSEVKEKRKKYVPGPKDAEGNAIAGHLKKGETRKTVLRKAPGNQLYEDLTLLEWDPAHKRLFIGDLGNDVNDAMLTKAFEKYPSFQKARVVRKKADDKSRGYGFVAFADPHDFLKAWKEMDGKHIGSRPCRIKKASEDVNPTEIGVRKDRLLAANAKYTAYKAKSKSGGAIGGELRRHGIGKAWGQK